MRSVLVSLLVMLAGCPSKDRSPPPIDPSVGKDDPAVEEPADTEEGVPRLERVDIGSTGLSAYLPRPFGEFKVEPSPDGAMVHSAEKVIGGFHFGVIALRFTEPLGTDAAGQEELLIAYLDYLKDTVGIVGSAGYGKGHTLDSDSSVVGVLDYWTDADGDQWVIKGWANDTHLAVLYVAGPGDYPIFNLQQMYLDGIRFEPVP